MNFILKGARFTTLSLFWLSLVQQAQAQQLNFEPLERGDYTEEEEKLTVVRGLAVSLDYAVSLEQLRFDESAEAGSTFNQDFRLRLRTVLHRNAEFLLSIEPVQERFSGNGLRERQEDQGRIAEVDSLSLNLRQAYLRYSFYPDSAVIMGKQEVSIGDRRGKVFNAIGPAITYDCAIGTWCMPFGAIKIGPNASDWIFHWALEYTAWDDKNNGYDNDALKVEIFRILYNEKNVPLGRNGGPAYVNPGPTAVDSSQALDDNDAPIHYDTKEQEYFGLRMLWDSGVFFFNFDFTFHQGHRALHRDDENPGDLTLASEEAAQFETSVSGRAWESEAGIRSQFWRLGLRVFNASGGNLPAGDSPGAYSESDNGYHEITPGAYQGTRLYFNGSDNSVSLGSGLGHSVHNVFMLGIFYTFSDPLAKNIAYQFGLFKLERNQPVLDINGNQQSNIGLELNNLLSLYVQESLRLELEVNIIDPQGAFTLDDFSRPDGQEKNLLSQGILRMVYTF